MTQTKSQALNATIVLDLSYMEFRQLVDIVRTEVNRRKALTTVSDWHEATYSLWRKIQAEEAAPAVPRGGE